ncbi:MAG: S46 family peptidase [Bacteroidales bacterium]
MTLKQITAGFLFAVLAQGVRADEGMWLMTQFQETIYPKMKKMGLSLKPGEIYNEEKVSLSDAIVAIDGGSCSGSMISNQGLLITNHHCAYGDVHAASTSEQNYLEDGFWAGAHPEELPIAGKTVQFLRRIIDVTDEAQGEMDKLEKEGFTGMKGRRIARILEEKYAKETGMSAQLASMWKGTKYYLFLYDEYSDVRLVAAPPVSIGAFGGEQDNWQWPQHKGDFAMYRVYTAPDGSPATYSPENVPLKPRRVLDISSKGIKEGDFTMILGYPGRIQRYVSSFEIAEKQFINNPVICDLRRTKLEIWKKYMDMDPDTRLKYSDRYFGTSNVTDYARWENKCFYRYDMKSLREEEEKELDAWLKADPARQNQYGNLIENLRAAYTLREDIMRQKAYYREGLATASDLLNISRRLTSLASDMKRLEITTLQPGDSLLTEFLNRMDRILYAQINLEADKEAFATLLNSFLTHVPAKFYGEAMMKVCEAYQYDAKKIADYLFDTSILANRDRLHQFFSVPRTADEFTDDIAITLTESVRIVNFNQVQKALEDSTSLKGDELEAEYVRALYAMRADKKMPQYPDANSTMRLTYGTVGGISPSDGIHYAAKTTIQGYLDKCDQSDYEFQVRPDLLELIYAKDFGRWAEKGTLPVNFLTNQDITGGNSGSAVLNGKGEVIGLAFDGNRESMAGDAYFHPELSKTVCVDIRFVLWLIEKYGKSGYLLQEMNIK